MRGDPAIIRLLNTVLTNELTSVNQYYLHARMYDNWGFKRLGKITYDESIGEMKHADVLIKRVLFLDGLPNLQDLHKLSIGETVPEALRADLALEQAGRATLLDGVKQCDDARDPGAHSRGHRGAHRLPRDTAQPAVLAWRAELPAVGHGRAAGRIARGLYSFTHLTCATFRSRRTASAMRP
jgi:bacterioferritin